MSFQHCNASHSIITARVTGTFNGADNGEMIFKLRYGNPNLVFKVPHNSTNPKKREYCSSTTSIIHSKVLYHGESVRFRIEQPTYYSFSPRLSLLISSILPPSTNSSNTSSSVLCSHQIHILWMSSALVRPSSPTLMFEGALPRHRVVGARPFLGSSNSCYPRSRLLRYHNRILARANRCDLCIMHECSVPTHRW
jgi:hypothetical protein